MTRTIVHVGRKIKVAIDTQTAADGTVFRRDVILHPGAVVILPVLDRDRVVLLRNHRFVIVPRVEESATRSREMF